MVKTALVSLADVIPLCNVTYVKRCHVVTKKTYIAYCKMKRAGHLNLIVAIVNISCILQGYVQTIQMHTDLALLRTQQMAPGGL